MEMFGLYVGLISTTKDALRTRKKNQYYNYIFNVIIVL